MTTLVLLPGLDGTGKLFAPLLAALPPTLPARVITYPPDGTLSYDALVARVTEELADCQSMVLLGESFSGPVAIKLAAVLGDRVTAVVLCCTFVRCPSRLLSWIPVLARFAPIHPRLNTVLARLLFGPRLTPSLLALFERALSEVAPTVLRRRLSEVAMVNVASQIASLRVPILYIQARSDILVPERCRHEVMSLVKDGRSAIVDGPHGLLQAAPTECALRICEFLASIEAA